ncbi:MULTISPECIES: hypothetical protein [unclassified Devosia]|uniref:hypothetical protein n=1 Tax=unclassified Devosia TaxID=196773 RepID=UPI001AC208F0|nr:MULTISPECIES: hypothetical protein [unclassified Devosia]MBN9304301.1 hypothetical protein [Devosia sp.]
MDRLGISSEATAEIDRLASRYLWWEPVAGHVHSTPRKIAQIMHLGTYEDVRRVEALAGAAMLAAIMRQSQPSWFDDKSWDFWRGRLMASGETDIPEHRPARSAAGRA